MIIGDATIGLSIGLLMCILFMFYQAKQLKDLRMKLMSSHNSGGVS